MWVVTLESHAADGLTRGAMAWPWGACCVCALSLWLASVTQGEGPGT